VIVSFSGCVDQSSEDKSTKNVTSSTIKNQIDELPLGCILINDSAEIHKVLGTEIETPIGPKATYVTAPPGRDYMILHIDIENNGYPKFDVDPSKFIVVMNDVEYMPTNMTCILQPRGVAILNHVKLRDGGKISGCLVYEVPHKDELEYIIEYVDQNEYNFQYGEQS
jgi:Telomeric repeat-binding factor 2.